MPGGGGGGCRGYKLLIGALFCRFLTELHNSKMVTKFAKFIISIVSVNRTTIKAISDLAKL